MKTFLYHLGMAFLAIISCSHLYAGNPNFSKEVTDVLITMRPSQSTEKPRTLPSTVITASLDDVLNVITISFENAGGVVSVSLENVDTLESSNLYYPGDGQYLIPFSGTAGCWVITIYLENGDEYYGSFIL